MKKFFAFLFVLGIVFSLVSCNQEKPLTEDTPSKEETAPEKVEESDPSTENQESEIEIEVELYAPYLWNDMETFLADFEQDATVRDWFFLVFDHKHSIMKDYPSVKDSIIIPKLKTDSFVCVKISAMEEGYRYWYLPVEKDPEKPYGGFSIAVSKTSNAVPSIWEEAKKRWKEDFEIFGDYAYNYTLDMLLLNEDGQEVFIEYNTKVFNFKDRASIEEIVEFERYGYNENGLYLITKE